MSIVKTAFWEALPKPVRWAAAGVLLLALVAAGSYKVGTRRPTEIPDQVAALAAWRRDTLRPRLQRYENRMVVYDSSVARGRADHDSLMANLRLSREVQCIVQKALIDHVDPKHCLLGDGRDR